MLALALSAIASGSSFERIRVELQKRRSQLEVLVVMSTTPRRLWTSLPKALASIFEQSLVPDRVVLSLPRGPMQRKPSEVYPEDAKLPHFLRNPPPGLIVDRECEDMGPGTGLLNGLRHARSLDALVIHLDDDQAYSVHHLAIMVYGAIAPENKARAVATVGLHSNPEFRPCLDQEAWRSGCVGRVFLGHTFGPLTVGWMGTIVRPWFFGPTGRFARAAASEWPKECQLHDDLWLGAMLARRGIRRMGGNWGLPGITAELEESRGSSALYSQNRWNLLQCNAALTSRWPALWEPRARLVGVGPAAREALATRCVGHIDQWHPRLEANLGTSLSALRAAVVRQIRLEDEDTVVLALSGEDLAMDGCATVSALVQCAMAQPKTICFFADVRRTKAAAASVYAWRKTNISHAQRPDPSTSMCWKEVSGYNATWGRCCWNHVAGIGVQQEDLKQVPLGCPPKSAGCCDVHPRLSRRWEYLADRWSVKYRDHTVLWQVDKEGRAEYVADVGFRGSPVWQLEESDGDSVVHLAPLNAAAEGTVEVWHLTQGLIKAVTILPGGQVRVGVGHRYPTGDVEGCV